MWLWFSYRIGKSTVSNNTNWDRISDDFLRIWNPPHCVGATDAKHVATKSPLKSRLLYYNYKGYFNMVLMTISHPCYCFTLVDTDIYDSNNDSGIFWNSVMGEKL